MPRPETTQAKAHFFEALDLEGEARAAFLAALRDADPALAERVEGLLRAHEAAEGAGIEPLAKGLLAEVARRAASVAAGAVVGDYELLEEVASGASGVVWRARQRSLDRVVAIKLLRTGSLAGAGEVERFREEAEAVARLDHPHIVPVYEISEAQGQTFFSMKWVPGGSLADRVDGSLSLQRVARLMVKTARAVHHAHQRGLLHRDLKPSNVLLDEAGEPHVADFGIAKRLDIEESGTGAAQFAGTPAYMAPEQAELESELTVEVDVWALGCLLYELIAGQQAFRGGSLTEVLRRVREHDPEPLRRLRPECPRDLETIAMRCLAKAPEDRYASANALAEDLQRWLDFEPIVARRASLGKRAVLYWRRSPLVATLLLALLVLVLAVAVGASSMSVRLRNRLRDSWRDQAVATRLSGVVGRRAAGLALLSQAAEVRPGPDLRDEAIATLALLDLDAESEWPLADGYANVAADATLATFAAVDAAGDIHLFDSDGEEQRVLPCEPPANRVQLSADGSRVLAKCYAGPSAGDDPHLRLWDVASGALLLDLPCSVSARAFGFSPDGARIAVGTLGGEVRVYDVGSGELQLARPVAGRAAALAFRPDGAALACVNLVEVELPDQPELLEVIAVPGGATLASLPIPAHPFDVNWCDGGRALLVATEDFRAWRWRPGAAQPEVEFVGHSAEVVDALPCGELPFVVTYSWDETLRLWDGVTGEQRLAASARPLAMSADGRRLAYRTNDAVGVWRLETGEVQRTLHAHSAKSPIALAFSPSGRLLVSAGLDGAVLWQTASGRRLGTLSEAELEDALFESERHLLLSGQEGLVRLDLEGEAAPVTLVSTPCREVDRTPDGARIAVRQGRSVRVIDPGRPGEDVVVRADTRLEEIFLAPSGDWLAAATWQGSGAHVWDARSGAALVTLLPEVATVTVAVSPRGDLLATGTRHDYRLWSTSDWRELHRFERALALTAGGGPLAFSPDGSRLAVLDDKEDIALYDTSAGTLLARLEAPDPHMLNCLVFSADGAQLAASSTSNHVQLWDLALLERELGRLGLTGR